MIDFFHLNSTLNLTAHNISLQPWCHAKTFFEANPEANDEAFTEANRKAFISTPNSEAHAKAHAKAYPRAFLCADINSNEPPYL